MAKSYVSVFKRWGPAVIIMLFLFSASSMPGAVVSDVKSVDILAHKSIHFVLYSLLCLSLYRAFKNVLSAILVTIIYGISDEIHQLFVYTRSGSAFDVLVDALGALFMGVILWKFYQNLPHKLKNWLEE